MGSDDHTQLYIVNVEIFIVKYFHVSISEGS